MRDAEKKQAAMQRPFAQGSLPRIGTAYQRTAPQQSSQTVAACQRPAGAVIKCGMLKDECGRKKLNAGSETSCPHSAFILQHCFSPLRRVVNPRLPKKIPAAGRPPRPGQQLISAQPTFRRNANPIMPMASSATPVGSGIVVYNSNAWSFEDARIGWAAAVPKPGPSAKFTLFCVRIFC